MRGGFGVLPIPPRPDDELAGADERQGAPASYSGLEYVLLEASSSDELQQKVNAYLRQGWRLQGGVAVATTGALQWWYYQAVVRQ
jgi:hypothetical protein